MRYLAPSECLSPKRWSTRPDECESSKRTLDAPERMPLETSKVRPSTRTVSGLTVEEGKLAGRLSSSALSAGRLLLKGASRDLPSAVGGPRIEFPLPRRR